MVHTLRYKSEMENIGCWVEQPICKAIMVDLTKVWGSCLAMVMNTEEFLRLLITEWVVELEESVQPTNPMILSHVFLAARTTYDAGYATFPTSSVSLDYLPAYSDFHTRAQFLGDCIPVNADLDFATAVLLA